jgi:hypothetical protein
MRLAPCLLVACSLALTPACTSSPAATPPSTRTASGLPFSITRLSETFVATAAEVIAVRGYTYARVTLDDGSERWIASLPKDISVGQRLSVRTFGSSSSFVSRQLHRTFPTLWFGMLSPSADPSLAPAPTSSLTTNSTANSTEST